MVNFMPFVRQEGKSYVVVRRADVGKLRRALEASGETGYEIRPYTRDLPKEVRRRFPAEAGPCDALLISRFKKEDVPYILTLAEEDTELRGEMEAERKAVMEEHEKNQAWREISSSDRRSGKPVDLAGGLLKFADTETWWEQLKNVWLDNMDEIMQWLTDSESRPKEIFLSERQQEAVGGGIRCRDGFLEYARAYRSRLVLIKERGTDSSYRFRIVAFYPDGIE